VLVAQDKRERMIKTIGFCPDQDPLYFKKNEKEPISEIKRILLLSV
jgi:hypothetical protein